MMEQAIASPLSAWESFYVIIGSASAALIGLQFVVIVLSAEMRALVSDSTTGAFATPTIVHFCAVLLISAVASAPWQSLSNAGAILALGGVVGCVYAVLVIRRTVRQKDYVPVFEDWIWYGGLPLSAYAALLIAALILAGQPGPSLFAIAGTALLLLFIGIHNSWDAVIYIAYRPREQAEEHADRPAHRRGNRAKPRKS